LGRGEGGWEKKIQRQDGKCRGEWIEENGWEVLNGNKQGDQEEKWTYIDIRRETVLDYGIVNEETWERVPTRIQNRREIRVGPSRNSFEETKGKNREGKGWWIGIKPFIFTFLELLFYV
jgi:hypothetical protein